MSDLLTPEHPQCRNCFCGLSARDAEQNEGACPGCGEWVCYGCGCTEAHACVRETVSLDGQHSTTSACDWVAVGLCSFCQEKAAYVLYMMATNREPVDQFYLQGYAPGQSSILLGSSDCEA